MQSVKVSAPPTDSTELQPFIRIRNVAVECFGELGFEVPLRVIADRAGVSQALIIHHYGSKERLRRACDDYAARLVVEINSSQMTEDRAVSFVDHFSAIGQHAWLLSYIVRSLRVGGPLAVSFYERMVADAQTYFETGVARGLVRPSRDPAARARWATSSALGSLVLFVSLHRSGELDMAELVARWTDEHLLATLEMYTEGVFTDSAILDAYAQHSEDEGRVRQAPDGVGHERGPVQS